VASGGYHAGAKNLPLAQPIVGIAATPRGAGYWLAAADGGVFSYGKARFHGSMGGRHLTQPIVGIAATSHGGGYWLVAADGGVFSFGNARYYGSMGGRRLDQPIVGITRTRSGRGYYLLARDGGVFAFGDAGYYGSLGGTGVSDAIGLATTPAGKGYWILRASGGKVCGSYAGCSDAGYDPSNPLVSPYSSGPSVANFGNAREMQPSGYVKDYVEGKPVFDLDFRGNPPLAIIGHPEEQAYFIPRPAGRSGFAPLNYPFPT
jgi:hypothetical protein